MGNSDRQSSILSLSVDELKAWMQAGKAIEIIDVRQPEEHAQGHLDGQLIPLDQLGPALVHLNPASCYVVYCQVGGRSYQAASLMVAAGFSHVYNLEGGYLAWRAAEIA